MPNHVKNRIEATPETLNLLIGETDEKEPWVDFRKIIAPPEMIVQESYSSHIKQIAEISLGLVDFKNGMGEGSSILERLKTGNAIRDLESGKMAKDFSDEDFEIFIQLMRAYRQCDGCMDWHDWNCKNWGTKWNSYDFERESDNVILFDTAWNAPHPVIEKLAEISHGEIIHEWADEDTGSNVGIRIYQPGQPFQQQDFSGKREGYELAFKLRPEWSDGWKLVDGEYQYFDPEEELTTP